MSVIKKRSAKGSTKKKAAAAVAVILMLSIAFGSTYAWKDYKQHKTNEFANTESKYEAVLSEDFQEKENWRVSDGKIKKTISVTNTGIAENGFEAVYVRIQLKEYMEIIPLEWEETADRYMIDTDGKYIVFETEAQARASYPDAPFDELEDGAYKILTDAVSGVTGWFIPTKEYDENGQYGKYVVTKYELDGDLIKVTGDDIDRADEDAQKSKKHDVAANGVTPDKNGECDYRKYIWEGTQIDSGGLFTNTAGNPTMEYIKWILGGNVITLSEWRELCEGMPVAMWIIDDTAGNDDPWIYWGQRLLPGEQTADFLSAVELIKQPAGNFYYALHTEMQAVSLNELLDSDHNWPEDIIQSYTRMCVNGVTVRDAGNIIIDNGSTVFVPESAMKQEYTFTADVDGINLAKGTVTWSIVSQTGTGATIGESDGKLQLPESYKGIIVVRATSDDDSSVFSEFTVCTETQPTLFYSEGNMTYGAVYSDETHKIVSEFTINLTSPVGGATERYFTMSTPTVPGAWNLNSGATGALLTPIIQNKVYKVSIPKDANAGTAKLTAGNFTVNINVLPERLESDKSEKGDTFKAAGIEWRMLAIDGTKGTMVIAEHLLKISNYHNTNPYPTWRNSRIRNGSTNSMASIYNEISNKDSDFASKISPTSLWTRDYPYQKPGYIGLAQNDWINRQSWYSQTFDKLFLLSWEEAFYKGVDNQVILTQPSSITNTGTAEVRTNGNHVLFADYYSRLATGAGISSLYWWLRSPGVYNNVDTASQIHNSGAVNNNGSGGSISNSLWYVTDSCGVRPAMWINSDRFTVSASGDAVHAADESNFTLDLKQNKSLRTVTLTGAMTGNNLTSNPGPCETSWTKSGFRSVWGEANINSTTYSFTIPADAVGQLIVTAKAIDDPARTVTVTVNVTYEGLGTNTNPYMIMTPFDLEQLASAVNANCALFSAAGKYYRQGDNIDLSGYGAANTMFNGGKGWVTIGSSYFSGNYDGSGHVISGLYINDTSKNNVGLFGVINNGGRVANLGVASVNIRAGNMVGGISGRINSGGGITNCYTTGTVSGNTKLSNYGTYAGGVAGDSYGSITNCYSACTVYGVSNYVGGVVGTNLGSGGVLRNCYSTGNVTGGEGYVGGIAGISGDNSSILANCYATGNVSGVSYVGGIAGQIRGGGSFGASYMYSCAALNLKVSGTAADSTNRVAGSNSATIAGNNAYSAMQGKTNWGTVGINTVNGASIIAGQAKSQVFWTTAANWNASYPWNTSVWTFEEGKLPILKDVGGTQTGNAPF